MASKSQKNNDTTTEDGPEPLKTEKISTFRRGLPQFLAVGAKNILLFGSGMAMGFPTILIPAIKGGEGYNVENENEFQPTEEQISWISSINLLCIPIGCIFSGVLTEPVGRRRAMQFMNIPLFISWLLLYFSTSISHIYAGLCLAGLYGGLMEAPVLTYVAEVTEPTFRGMLAATGTGCVITGIFTQFVLGTFMHWRTVAITSSVLPIIAVFVLFFVPESPYWLLARGREEKAQKSLCWLRGWVTFDKVEKEFAEIHTVIARKVARDKNANHAVQFRQKMKPYFQKTFLMPFALVAAVFAIGHFTGKTPLQTYAVDIFSTLKAPIDKYKATVILGAAELIGTIICILLVHTTKKRPLVFISLVGCGSCFLATATYAHYMHLIPGVAVNNVVANVSGLNFDANEIITNNIFNGSSILKENETVDFTTVATDFMDFGNESSTSYEGSIEVTSSSTSSFADKILLKIPHANENELYWIPLILLVTAALFAHIGIRIIPWMLIGEVFPSNVRGGASGLASAVGYLFGFLSNKLFLGMVATMTLPGTFWFYSGVALLGAVVLYFILPETEGRSLPEIEAHFAGNRSLSGKKIHTNNILPMKYNDVIIKQGCDHITEIPNELFSTKNISTLDVYDNNGFDDHLHDTMNLPEHIRDSKAIGLKKTPRPNDNRSGNFKSYRDEDDSTNL